MTKRPGKELRKEIRERVAGNRELQSVTIKPGGWVVVKDKKNNIEKYQGYKEALKHVR